MSPPVGSTLMREVMAGGLTVDGEWFLPGTDIAVPHYALHHDERYFPDPSEFKPQRCLSKHSSTTVDVGLELDDTVDSQHEASSSPEALAASAFTAFGVGITSCIGKYLAYREIALLAARTIWLFDMRLAPGSTLD
jgi:cytochrome P450